MTTNNTELIAVSTSRGECVVVLGPPHFGRRSFGLLPRRSKCVQMPWIPCLTTLSWQRRRRGNRPHFSSNFLDWFRFGRPCFLPRRMRNLGSHLKSVLACCETIQPTVYMLLTLPKHLASCLFRRLPWSPTFLVYDL